VAQTTSNISAVQTSLQKLNELLSQDRDWSTPVDHTATRASTISEGSRSIHEHTSEANRPRTHNDRDTTFSKVDSRQSQSTDRHVSQAPQANADQSTIEMRRTKSDSAGTHNTIGLVKAHRVSDKSTHHDLHDPHQQFAPQRRREQIVATSSSQ
jgi:hypothetical protein